MKLGKRVMDIVTGFKGTSYGYCQYISGCSQILVLPDATDNNHKEGTWFDEQRVKAIEVGEDGYKTPLVLDNGELAGSEIEAPRK